MYDLLFFMIKMVVNDFNELTSKIEHVYEVRLIGGEPFVNKDIYRIIDFFNESNKITKLVIYTNATIPLKPELMKKYANPKLVFSMRSPSKKVIFLKPEETKY